MVRHFGKPDLFLTFTCNPKWPEIADNIPEGLSHLDCPFITNVAFHLRDKMLLDDIVVKKYFGKVAAYVGAIEYQKSGLVHRHWVFWLADGFKILTSDHIDAFVSAVLADQQTSPYTHAASVKFQLHDKCGEGHNLAKCRPSVTEPCELGFPKDNSDITVFCNERGRAVVKRPVNSPVFLKANGDLYTTRDVVETNPRMMVEQQCSTCLEITTSTKCLEYIIPYVLKGSDSFIVEAHNRAPVGEGQLHAIFL